MRPRIVALLSIALAAEFAHSQTAIQQAYQVSVKVKAAAKATPEVVARAIARTPGIPMLVTSTISPSELGTVEILNDNEPAGILPAVVSAHDNGEITLVEYGVDGKVKQRFHCKLVFHAGGTLPQAISASGENTYEANEALTGVWLASDIGYTFRFDKRLRFPTGKYLPTLHALSVPKGYAEVMFDSTPEGATIVIPSHQITATTPAPLSLKYRTNDTIVAYIKRDGNFDAKVTLRFETDDQNTDWMVTGDGRYAIPSSPTSPIARVVATFEPIESQ
jgi:hypothetical protein